MLVGCGVGLGWGVRGPAGMQTGRHGVRQADNETRRQGEAERDREIERARERQRERERDKRGRSKDKDGDGGKDRKRDRGTDGQKHTVRQKYVNTPRNFKNPSKSEPKSNFVRQQIVRQVYTPKPTHEVIQSNFLTV